MGKHRRRDRPAAKYTPLSFWNLLFLSSLKLVWKSQLGTIYFPRHFRATRQSQTMEDESIIHLPHDIIVEILLRLPVKTLSRFRRVCKLWNSLTCDPSFIDAHRRLRAPHKSILCFKDWTDLPPITMSKLDLNGKLVAELIFADLPVAYFYRLSNFVNGLVVVYESAWDDRERGNRFLLNPQTRESMMLPPPNIEGKTFLLGLGFSTCTREYKVVRGFTLGFGQVDFWVILTIGSNKWRFIEEPHVEVEVEDEDENENENENGLQLLQFPGSRPVWLHGMLHWMVRRPTAIISFHMDEEKFKSFSAPSECHNFEDVDVVELDEHLCVAGISYEELNLLQIWKMEDYDHRVWTKVYKINLPAIEHPRTWRRVFIIGSQHDYILLDLYNERRFGRYDLWKETLTILNQEEKGPYYMYNGSLAPFKN